MDVFQILLGISILFWTIIFIYVVWVDRKISSLKKVLSALEEKEE
jgi:hypothetical protein